uniref:Uncharacterized protein n=2 Tax=Physcomitrium patens TaxID=3218 RepID=A0A2K1IWQ9_PHYPA|nr:hypothetical protein PHYPA_023528 [Physcomitrium patens]
MWPKWETRRRCIPRPNKEFLLYLAATTMSIGSRTGAMLVAYDDMSKAMSDGVFGAWTAETKPNEALRRCSSAFSTCLLACLEPASPSILHGTPASVTGHESALLQNWDNRLVPPLLTAHDEGSQCCRHTSAAISHDRSTR